MVQTGMQGEKTMKRSSERTDEESHVFPQGLTKSK